MAAGFFNKLWNGIKKGAQKVANIGKTLLTKGVDIAKKVADNGIVRNVADKFIPGASNVLDKVSGGLGTVQKLRDRIFN